MDSSLKDIFAQVEKYLVPLVSKDPPSAISKDESRILALQQINRLNHRIGQLARGPKESNVDVKILQTYVNRLTIGVKTNNDPQIRSSLISVRNYIESLDSTKI
ncbi:MAG: hypothetical protein OK457_00840 [Thaumarchaeota archaeon]|nr:hypothetical protein [Nitrososphaerota archaeon]